MRLRQEKGPDLVGDREQGQAMSHRTRDVERIASVYEPINTSMDRWVSDMAYGC